MPGLSKPLSVRVSEQDTAFLSDLQIDGAATPSEKVRALIAEARAHAQSPSDPEAAKRIAQSVLGPVQRRIQEAEKATGQHSELLATELAWLNELLMRLVMLPAVLENAGEDDLKKAESLVTARVVELVDRTLRYGLTEKTPAYDPHMLAGKLETIEEILEIFANRRVKSRTKR